MTTLKLKKFNFAEWIYTGMKSTYLSTGQKVELEIVHPDDEDPLFRGRIEFSDDDIVYHYFEFNGIKCEKSFKKVTDLMMEDKNDR